MKRIFTLLALISAFSVQAQYRLIGGAFLMPVDYSNLTMELDSLKGEGEGMIFYELKAHNNGDQLHELRPGYVNPGFGDSLVFGVSFGTGYVANTVLIKDGSQIVTEGGITYLSPTGVDQIVVDYDENGMKDDSLVLTIQNEKYVSGVEFDVNDTVVENWVFNWEGDLLKSSVGTRTGWFYQDSSAYQYNSDGLLQTMQEFSRNHVDSAFTLDATYSFIWKSKGSSSTADAESAELTVFPNPSTGQITVSAEGGIDLVSVYNASGQQVNSANAGGAKAISLNITDAGIYQVVIQSGNEVSTETVVVQ